MRNDKIICDLGMIEHDKVVVASDVHQTLAQYRSSFKKLGKRQGFGI